MKDTVLNWKQVWNCFYVSWKKAEIFNIKLKNHSDSQCLQHFHFPKKKNGNGETVLCNVTEQILAAGRKIITQILMIVCFHFGWEITWLLHELRKLSDLLSSLNHLAATGEMHKQGMLMHFSKINLFYFRSLVPISLLFHNDNLSNLSKHLYNSYRLRSERITTCLAWATLCCCK